MSTQLARTGGRVLAILSVIVWSSIVDAQTFSSGSTGNLGVLAPAANTIVTLPPDGILNYTTVTIPAGVTVTFTPNATNTPVTMLATGDITIAGTVNISGVTGALQSTSVVFNPGGPSGPGGFAGGQGGSKGLTNNPGSDGLGPGGGRAGIGNFNAPSAVFAAGGTYGAPSSFVSLLPLFGGSGGGGVDGGTTATQLNDPNWAGASGGGGGGAIVIASTTRITIPGSILANGGSGVAINNFVCPTGSGSGGAIRLVAPEVSVSGNLQATSPFVNCTGPGAPGRIRIEARTPGFIAPTNPTASVVSTLGPMVATSIPALINLPTLTFSSIGGSSPPIAPTGSYTTADVTLPAGTTNPVPVTLTATNTPVPTTFTIKVIPQFAATATTTATMSGGFAVSTGSATVTFPGGRISALQAFAGFTLTASLAPIIDGEPADRVLMAANYGGPSTLTLMTKSGREVPVSQLSQEDQLKVALAIEAMRQPER